MKSSEICACAINIVAGNYGPTTYRLGNTNPVPQYLNNMTWYDGAFRADCLGFVRACLCGFTGDKTVYYGGAQIDSYNCRNFNEWAFVESCYKYINGVKTNQYYYDFSDLFNHPCSLLMRFEPFRHVGLYVGEYSIDGHTYNVCECSSSFNCCTGTWVDNDGTRRYEKNGAIIDSLHPWYVWGIFNTDGLDYDITEYDGGSIGATGFGTALSEDDVARYWDTLSNLTYDYVESIADSIHGMSADVFAVMAGWDWGEGYASARPVNWNEPDIYMGYLCDCVPVNYFHGLGITTGPAMAAWIRQNGGSYYSYESMVARANNLKVNEATWMGQQSLKALLLALLNPNQDAWYCNGYPNYSQTYQEYPITIYQNDYPNEGTIYVFYYPSEQVTYDVTGSGIRGGAPSPGPTGRRVTLPIYMMVKPYHTYSNYIIGRR